MIDPIPIRLVETAELRLKKFIKDKVMAILEGTKDIRETKLVNWRKAYEGVPAEATREFPFHGASNLIVPIVAIHSDTLLARVMAAIFKISPLWVSKLIGEYEEKMEDARIAFEMYMAYIGIEPTELDLYRVYHEWCGEAIRYGTSVVKCPVVRELEDYALGANDGLGKVTYFTDTKYHGSKPEKLPFNDFGIAPDSKTVESAGFKFHRIRYQRERLEELAYLGIYDKEAVKAIIGKPDTTSPDTVAQQQQTDAGARNVSGYGYAEYWVYECHFKYKLGRHYTRCIAWYNLCNDKLLRLYHFYYPDDIFVAARLFYRDDFFYGYGFAETLGMLQEEISTIHNQRRDNSTIANTKAFRVDPDSELNKGYRIFPSAQLPAKKDEIEALDTGTVNPMTIDEERLTLELAEKRSGVSAPIQGMGSGAMSKRGVYSSMGTLSLLQEGNTRTDLNITDIRYAHTKLGRIVAHQETEFFADDMSRYRKFGKAGEKIQMALKAYKNGMLTMPVYAATASVNREVEKQSDLMLAGLAQKTFGAVAQMLQGATNQFTGPVIQKYMMDAAEASTFLLKQVFRHFNYDEVDRYVPSPEKGQQAGGPPPQAPPQPASAPVPPGVQQGGGGLPDGATPHRSVQELLTSGIKM